MDAPPERPGPPVLLLLDLQEDFLARASLVPGRSRIVARAAELLEGWRARGLPVVHVRTVYRADGADRMPHRRRAGERSCTAGTPGAEPPPALRARDGERVLAKRFYSAFGAAGLAEHLAALGADIIVLAGLYLHACVRSTALDAYERGLAVWIAEDASGTTEPVHAELTREYLMTRAARYESAAGLLLRLDRRGSAGLGESDEGETFVHRSPADRGEVLRAVRDAGEAEVQGAAAAAVRAARSWGELAPEERAARLFALGEELAAREQELVRLVVREVGKPVAEAREELARARAHVASAARLAAQAGARRLAAGVRVRHAPRGVVAVVTPWNNPVAIPLGKLAPALGLGNAVLWKPSPRASLSARALAACFAAVELPAGLLGVVEGGAETARRALAAPGVSACSVTGSGGTGAAAAALCARLGRPLQAELGGNNAAVVLADADLEEAAARLARAAFGFAGQRCTALRRFVVEREVLAPFQDAVARATAALRVGHPAREETDVGPVISDARRDELLALLERAADEGGEVIAGGTAPRGAELERGAYLLPALVTGLAPDAELVREESFGPVAVIQAARDRDHALELLNAVPQGLLAAVCTRDAAALRDFEQRAEAGLLRLDLASTAIHPEAPFGGWKASGLGPPEHGRWDLETFTRAQAIYAQAIDGGTGEC